ncbi:MAG: hypothetical protein IPP94_10650 [Ignavibacteria bacterium]|nr:hypothetical protein [Ignavibacteria bacterium]
MSSLRGKHSHLPSAASIAGVILFHAVLVAAIAQTNTIGFAGRDALSLAPVVLDSVRIFNLTAGRDTLIPGGQRFDIDWLSALDGSVEGPAFHLGTNYPNGFSGRTLFDVVLPAAAGMQVSVHSLRGERCAAYAAEMDAGVHRFEFNAGALPPGVYLVTASASGLRRTMKIMLMNGSGEGSPAIIRTGSAALQGTPAGAPAGATVYNFVGYAKLYAPDTMRFITPVAGTTYTFDLDALGIPGRIVTGAFTPLLQQSVPPTGATIEVNKAGDAFHGLKLIVADSAYPDTRTFELSSAPVLGHSLDTNFRIISPMLRVKNGGGYSGVPMSIRIPVHVPPGDFAMAFLYNEKTGDIEGLPILELDAAQVTCDDPALRHIHGDVIRKNL